MQAIAEGVPVRLSKKRDEKLPLKYSENGGVYRPWYAPHGSAFNIIILCMVIFSIAVTVALIVQIAYQDRTTHYGGSIVTENYQCGSIGQDVLEEGGSAVDAAIAVHFCLGVTMPHMTGIGGGGFLVVFKNGVIPENTSINFREMLPRGFRVAATPDHVKTSADNVGVPGTLRGLESAHKMYGKLAWERLLRPSIQLALEGFEIGTSLFASIHQVELTSPYLRELFIPNGSSVYINEKITRPSLANTLNTIAVEGSNALYNGSLTKNFIRDVQSQGSLLSTTDLNNYEAIKEPPITVSIGGYQILASSYPSSGPALIRAIQLMNTSDSFGSVSWYTSLLEAIEGSTKNPQNLDGNEEIGTLSSTSTNPDDEPRKTERSVNQIVTRTPAAATVIALDSDELFVTLVSGLGSLFGSQIVTTSGIILNDALVDIDLTAEEPVDRPMVRPQTSMVAEVVVEPNRPCGLRLVAASRDYQMLIQTNLNFLSGALTTLDAFMHPRIALLNGKGKVVVVDDNNSGLNAQTLDHLSNQAGYVIIKGNSSMTPVGVIGKQKEDSWSYTDSKPESFNVNF